MFSEGVVFLILWGLLSNLVINLEKRKVFEVSFLLAFDLSLL